MPPLRCITCGYDLRGTYRDGVCPECGTPAINSEGRSPFSTCLKRRLRRMLPYICASLMIAFIALSYLKVEEAWVCPECARSYYHDFHTLRTPFTHIEFPRIPAGRPHHDLPTQLTAYLDPEGNCAHEWRPFGDSASGLLGGWRGIGLHPAGTWVAYEEDFDAFIASMTKKYPNLEEEIRRRIRERDSLAGWMSDEYMTWRETVASAPGN